MSGPYADAINSAHRWRFKQLLIGVFSAFGGSLRSKSGGPPGRHSRQIRKLADPGLCAAVVRLIARVAYERLFLASEQDKDRGNDGEHQRGRLIEQIALDERLPNSWAD